MELAPPAQPPGKGPKGPPGLFRPPRLPGAASGAGAPSAARQRRPGRLSRHPLVPLLSIRTGLQGKLVLCFMVMVTSALGVSCWMFASATREVMGQMKGGNEAYVRNVQLSVVLIGAVAVLVSWPVMYWLVGRVFRPIRQLVAAADRIARGHLETRVDLVADRDDVISTLARSFNEMVKRVRQQQEALGRANQQLATANARLAEANFKLSEANHDLEEKVRQRTAQAEATARQLSAANRRLSSEISEKEDFLRAVSHDLNAPLRNIAGMASMLLMKYRDVFDEDVVRRLERIQKNVEVETGLIAELLELSRIKTRRQNLETVDLNGMLAELRELFAQDLESRRIALLVDQPLPALRCERARLRQVFQNLIDNAIKYMGEEAGSGPKPREIHVGCSVGPEEAEFYVRDTGIGIEPEDLDKVFHVFRRGRNAAAQSATGKGVGLASVKGIIETYNGTIWVESQPGQGSMFRFTINGKYLPAAADIAATGRDGIQDASRTTTSPLTIAPMTEGPAREQREPDRGGNAGGNPASTAA